MVHPPDKPGRSDATTGVAQRTAEGRDAPTRPLGPQARRSGDRRPDDGHTPGASAVAGEPTGLDQGRSREAIEAIGPYRILELLGEGGMGCVYLAEQSEPVRREVAIKLVSDSLLSAESAARFIAEQQVMARLAHPNIGQMFEASTTDDGRPYFVMEHVRGASLIEHCDRETLSLEERLRLFVDLCRGVEHAHQKGVIHRDLKPFNVLVAEIEDRAVPKIIDFGIAKVTQRRAGDQRPITDDLQLGTPAYMSPEAISAEAGSVDLDTRADVYSLGVVLQELLAGVRPFDQVTTGSGGMFKKVVEPALPASVEFGALPVQKAEAAAARRGETRGSLIKRLAEDLDWIIARATAKGRDDRYGSAAALAADVERYLSNRPVLARPPSLQYRLKKTWKRRKVPLIAVAALLFGLLGGLLGISLGLLRARAAEAEARAAEALAVQEAEAVRQVSGFLTELFASADPWRQRDELTVRELLDLGTRRINDELKDQPLQRARLMATMGSAYRSLADLDRAESLMTEAVQQMRSFGGGTEEIVNTLVALGDVYAEQGRFDESVAVITEAVEMGQKEFSADHDAVVAALQYLAQTHHRQGNSAEAVELLRQSKQLELNARGEDSPAFPSVLSLEGAILGQAGRFQEAEVVLRQSLALRQQRSPGSLSVADTMSSLALVVWNLGDEVEGERLMREAVDIYERTLGPQHSSVSLALGNLGYRLFRAGRADEAVGPLERVVANDAEQGWDDGRAASRATNLGLVYWKLGRLKEAEPLFHRANAIRTWILAADHPHRATSLWGLANVYRDQGRLHEADALYSEALEIRQNALPPGHPELQDALREYAILLRKVGQEERARELEARL